MKFLREYRLTQHGRLFTRSVSMVLGLSVGQWVKFCSSGDGRCGNPAGNLAVVVNVSPGYSWINWSYGVPLLRKTTIRDTVISNFFSVLLFSYSSTARLIAKIQSIALPMKSSRKRLLNSFRMKESKLAHFNQPHLMPAHPLLRHINQQNNVITPRRFWSCISDSPISRWIIPFLRFYSA